MHPECPTRTAIASREWQIGSIHLDAYDLDTSGERVEVGRVSRAERDWTF